MLAINKYSYEYVYNYFKENDCLLLSQSYKNTDTILKYQCSCGNIHHITFKSFLRGARCDKCASKKRSLSHLKYSQEDVEKIFSDANCILLSKDYYSTNQKLDYICSCGNKSSIVLSHFLNSVRCKKCGYANRIDPRGFTYEYVYNFFKESGCVLLSETYKNRDQKLEYICSCGNIAKISFEGFKRGDRCRQCGILKMSGVNNPNWAGGISSLNAYLRYSIKEWKLDSIKKDNYQCQISGKRKNFVLHHLYPFHKIVKETIKLSKLPIYKEVNQYSEEELILLASICLDLHYKYGLGVCISVDLHKKFHKIYGTRNFTPEQFEEFKNNYKSPPEGDFLISQVS